MGIYDLFRQAHVLIQESVATLPILESVPKGEGIWKLIFCDGFCKIFHLKEKNSKAFPCRK